MPVSATHRLVCWTSQETITRSFQAQSLEWARRRSLLKICDEPYDPTVVFSEYHARGAVSGAFMIRKGDWKYIHYVGFEPELFDLGGRSRGTVNLAEPNHAQKLRNWKQSFMPSATLNEIDASPHADQAAMIEAYGGRDAALKLGAPPQPHRPR